MTVTSASATYDPATTAQQLATAYTAPRQQILDAQTAKATASAAALSKLGAALTTFNAAQAALSLKKSLLANSATLSDSTLATASATNLAAAGSYSFYVEQQASANQVSYSGLADSPAVGSGTLAISIGGGLPVTVNLGTADSNGDGAISAKEIAIAINAAPNNGRKVTASVLTINGTAQLILSAGATGANSQITLDTSGVSNAAIKGALDLPANAKQLVAPKDAIVWLGAQGTGTKLQQASNTYTAIDGVTLNLAKVPAGGAPLTVTVGSDGASTTANVQSFVDAYNALHALLASQTDAGDPSKSVSAGIFANDTGVTVLMSRLASAVRDTVGGLTLANFGVTASRDGVLSVNTTKLSSALAANPSGLDQLFGSTSVGAKSGVMGELDKYINLWSNTANGQIMTRQAAVTREQRTLTNRQADLDAQFNSAYKRYNAQFTALQSLQAQMASTTSMFDALFGSKTN
jgi:flagellar hook-associated protein 2